MSIGSKIYSIYGWLTVKGKRYSPVGNKVLFWGVDEQGKAHDITDNILKDEPKDNTEEKKKEQEKEDYKKDIQDKIKTLSTKDFNVHVKNFPVTEKLTGKLDELKKTQERTVEAIRNIPETKIPEVKIPDHKDEYELWKDEVLEALKIEIPKVDLAPVIKAIEKIKIPASPKQKDYTKLLTEIKKTLPPATDLEPILEAIRNIPKFEIPDSLIYKDHLKVTPDRVGSGGAGGLKAADSAKLQLLATEAKQDTMITAISGGYYDSVEVDTTNDPVFTITKKLGAATIDTKTITII